MAIAIRKFNDTETLGDALRVLRLSIPRTLSEMSTLTKIPKNLLEAFEKNAFLCLPQPSYARRFLKKYVDALGGDEAYFLQRFEEERGTCDLTTIARLPPRRANPGSQFTPFALAKIGALGLGTLTAICYLGFQVRSITAPPKLAIETPSDGYVTQNAVVKMRGRADTKSTVKVNGMEVLTRTDGQFETDIALERGLNIVMVESAKRYSQTAKAYRRIILEQGQSTASVGVLPSTQTN